MKLLIMVAASAFAATLVLPTISYGDTGGQPDRQVAAAGQGQPQSRLA